MARNPGIPHYRRIADRLLTFLEKTDAFRLPSENALARQYGVARMTARRALEWLRAQGFVERVRGSGSFASAQHLESVHFIGYFLHMERFAGFRSRLFERLGQERLQLVTIESGLHGEHLSALAPLAEAISRSRGVVWFAPSHPEGLAAAIRLRRKLPVRQPCVLINDPMGLSLQGNHRFDLVHFDLADAARRLVRLLAGQGVRHPVLIRRRDVHLYLIDELDRGFTSALLAQGVGDAPEHRVVWEPGQRLGETRWRLGWEPEAFVLEYDYVEAFRHYLNATKSPWREVPVIAFGRREPGWNLAGNTRMMADIVADLLLSRLNQPTRANLHVSAHLPVRRSVAQKVIGEIAPSAPAGTPLVPSRTPARKLGKTGSSTQSRKQS